MGKLLKEDLEKALAELGEVDESVRFELRKPEVIASVAKQSDKKIATSSTTPRNDILFDFKKV